MSAPLRLSFRSKVMSIVALLALALAGVVLAGSLLGRRTERELETIRVRYLPLVELQPRLEGDLDRLKRGFQDAVAAGDLLRRARRGTHKRDEATVPRGPRRRELRHGPCRRRRTEERAR